MEITRPIVGIENRTAQEVFDIMCERIRLSPAPVAVKVRELEFYERKTDTSRHFQCNTILGQYQIAYLGEFECWQLHSPHKSLIWKECFSRHSTSDEAKAAAQQDYSSRILSALELPNAK